MNTLIHCTICSLPVKIKMMVSIYLLFILFKILLFNVACEDENSKENEIIDQDYMFGKRVTVRTVEEKNGENIDTFEITKVFVKIISGPYIWWSSRLVMRCTRRSSINHWIQYSRYTMMYEKNIWISWRYVYFTKSTAY